MQKKVWALGAMGLTLALAVDGLATPQATLQTGYQYDDAFGHGPYLSGEAGVWIGRTFQLLGGYRLESAVSDLDVRHVFDVALRYPLDVFRFVPWLEVAPLFVLDQTNSFGGRGAIGLDWMLSPTWSLGLAAYYQRTTESYGLTLGIGLTYRIEESDRWDP